MTPMFLSVFLSSAEQTEVPITPETLCRDVVEFCKEPGEGDCYLAQAWGGAERVLADSERIVEVMQRGAWPPGAGPPGAWPPGMGPPGAGPPGAEVQYLLHHQRAPPGPDTGGRSEQMNAAADRCLDQVTLSDLQDLATRQQQQIDAQQQLLVSKEQRLQQLREQEASEQQNLTRLRQNAENQEEKLRRVRKLRGRVEERRRSNSRLAEEMEQLRLLFHQKQRELVAAAARAQQLSEQLEALRSRGGAEPQAPPPHHRDTGELERLYAELQLRNRLNQEQSSRLQQQRDVLTRRNQEVAATERRLAELRRRLAKKKAALRHKENLPVPAEGAGPQRGPGSRVAAVGPYIQSGPRGPAHDSSLKPPPRPVKPAAGSAKTNKLSDWNGPSRPDGPAPSRPDGHASTLPRMSSLRRRNSGGDAQGSDAPPPVPARANHSADNLLRDTQPTGLAPPPRPSKPKPGSPCGPRTFCDPGTGTFPGKARQVGGHRSHTLPLPGRQESPPAAAVRPYAPDEAPPPHAPPHTLPRPQTVAAASIYSMYTQQAAGGQGTLPRSQPRVYGKPVLPPSGGQQQQQQQQVAPPPDTTGADQEPPAAAAAPPRPLSPTKLLPFLSNRKPSAVDLEALRRRLHRSPRPLKKRSSITEPEGPAGPDIQKLLYQKTTLAAMETVAMETVAVEPGPAGLDGAVEVEEGDRPEASPEETLTPPPLPPRSPIPDSAPYREEEEDEGDEEEEGGYLTSAHHEDFPPYPPPPYPSCGGGGDAHLRPPEVTGQVVAPPGKKSILRRGGSQPIRRDLRVKFNPLALLLDSSLEGEFDLVQRVIYDVDDPSAANDEGITALHNAVCAGHADIVNFLVQFGVNVNAADSDGWTPLHCAASCNNAQVCKFLVESGAAVFATTHSDAQTAADKCEEMEDGYAQCSQFLYGVQEKMAVMNRAVVYALWDYASSGDDELSFSEGDVLTVLRRDHPLETDWWWARCGDHEGFVPRNLLGIYPRIKPRQRSLA